MAESLLKRLGDAVARADLHRRHGRVSDLIGLIVEATGLEAEVGEVCEIATGRGRAPVPAEVVGFRSRRTLLMPLGELHGIGPGNVVTATGEPVRVPVGDELLGRVLDGLGRPIDQGEELPDGRVRSAAGAPPDALERPRIRERVGLGVRVLDGMVPCGRGQRLGIFAGSGRGQVVAAGHDRPLHDGRHQRDLPRRRAWPRGARVHRARPRRRHRPFGRHRRHLRPAGARAHQGGADRDLDRRALPRQGPRRPADDGLGHALRQRPARGRPRHRRAARHPRLHAQRLRPAPQAASSAPAPLSTARSPGSTRCSSTATT
jgi:hypothetical protein